MADDKQDEILDMVREQLQRTNPPSTEALYGRAARIEPAIRELTLRQFNARYPLRVRREMAQGQSEQAEAEAVSEDELRSTIREVMLEFARQVASTPRGPEFVELIDTGIESYVEHMIEKVEAL